MFISTEFKKFIVKLKKKLFLTEYLQSVSLTNYHQLMHEIKELLRHALVKISDE